MGEHIDTEVNASRCLQIPDYFPAGAKIRILAWSAKITREATPFIAQKGTTAASISARVSAVRASQELLDAMLVELSDMSLQSGEPAVVYAFFDRAEELRAMIARFAVANLSASKDVDVMLGPMVERHSERYLLKISEIIDAVKAAPPDNDHNESTELRRVSVTGLPALPSFSYPAGTVVYNALDGGEHRVNRFGTGFETVGRPEKPDALRPRAHRIPLLMDHFLRP